MGERVLRAFVDRIEGEIAVLLIGDDARQVSWPASELPEGAVEGCVIQIVVRTDPDATRAARNEIDSLIDRLNRE